jgi:hypothetical protein
LSFLTKEKILPKKGGEATADGVVKTGSGNSVSETVKKGRVAKSRASNPTPGQNDMSQKVSLRICDIFFVVYTNIGAGSPPQHKDSAAGSVHKPPTKSKKPKLCLLPIKMKCNVRIVTAYILTRTSVSDCEIGSRFNQRIRHGRIGTLRFQ